jgi:uncharacterized protein YbjT (DUF2867 family)
VPSSRRIVVFGAAGKAGSRVVAEAHARGHEVTVAARDLSGSLPGGARAVSGDATGPGTVAAGTSGSAHTRARERAARPGQRGRVVVPRAISEGARTISRGVARPWSRRSTAAVTACRACSSAFWLTVVRSKQARRDRVSSS